MDTKAASLEAKASKRDAKGKGGGDRLREAATNMRANAAVLRDTSATAAVANLLTPAEYKELNRPPGSVASTVIGGRETNFLRASNGVLGNEGMGSQWIIGHEGFHLGPLGLEDQKGRNGALAYRGFDQRSRDALNSIRGTDIGARNPDSLLEMIY